jgi:hypothetical protein
MSLGSVLRWRIPCKCFTKRVAAAAITALALTPCQALLASDHTGKVAVVATTVDRLIDEAGSAKSDGNVALAYAMLHDVVRIAPDNPQARWQLGQVKVQGEWLSVEEAQRRAANDPRQAKYRERKDTVSDAPDDQLALARWCRKNQLDDEARVHLTSVLNTDPNNKPALRAVGMHWHDGQLLSPGQLKETRKETSSAKRSLRQWETAVAGWMRALSDKYESPSIDVLDEIRAIDDVVAIPAFEKVTLNSELQPSEKNPAPQRLSLAFLKALRDMESAPATDSLARYAVRSPFGDVRSEAIAELRFRPLTDFVPTLLDALTAPIKSSFRVQNDPDGSVHYLREAYREGPFADRLYRTSRSILQPGSTFGVLDNRNATNAAPAQQNVPAQSTMLVNATSSPDRAVTYAGAVRAERRYQQEIVAGEQQVQASNQQTAARNERIFAVLTGVSDQNFGNDPRAWWSWWQDYTDYYRGGERPVNTTIVSSREYIVPPQEESNGYGDERGKELGPVPWYRMPPPPPWDGRIECFVRGTPVWTKTGQKPIESLTAGDLVLAQNVNTGEIAYRPVLTRTLRPAGPTLEITAGGEKIFSTRGHPLWVDGVGWRMAKELEDGALLHSMTGTTRIESVRPSTDAETYNLVVADFNTYFVGENGILVHDNIPRQPTQAVVPGITAH